MSKEWNNNFEINLCPFCYEKMLFNIETQRPECYNPECPEKKAIIDTVTDNLISYGEIEIL